MANIKSAKKRIKVAEVKTKRNRMVKSALKTSIKKLETAIEAKNLEDAKALFISTTSALDSAAQKGILHKNAAARHKSRLDAKIKALA